MKAKYLLGLVIIVWIGAWSATARSNGLEAAATAGSTTGRAVLLDRINHLIEPGPAQPESAYASENRIWTNLPSQADSPYELYRTLRGPRFTLTKFDDGSLTLDRKGLRLKIRLGR
jgi:hypothetical protein